MGSAVSAVTDSVQNVTKNPMDAYKVAAAPGAAALRGVGSATGIKGFENLANLNDPFGGIMSKYGGDGGAQAPSAPGQDSMLSDFQEKQRKFAEQFRSGMGQMGNDLGERVGVREIGSLNKDLKKITEGASSRGLLNSGMAKAEQAQRKAQAVGNIAQGRSTINAQLAQQADQLDAQAIGAGLQAQQNQQVIQDQVFNQAIQNMQNKMGVGGALGGAGGSLIGSYLGRK